MVKKREAEIPVTPGSGNVFAAREVARVGRNSVAYSAEWFVDVADMRRVTLCFRPALLPYYI